MNDAPGDMRTPAPRERFGPRLSRHLGELMHLAWPVMLSRAGILIMAFVDIAMLGRYGPGAVGVSNLGLAVFVPVLVFSIGLVSGVIAEVSQAKGRGDWAECGRAWRRALVWGVVVSTLGAWVVWEAEALLLLFGQDPELAKGGGEVARALAPGLIAQAIFAVCAFYLEATGRPLVSLWVMLAANVGNAGLNWLFIFGNWGMPEMGATGAALATTLVRIGGAVVMIAVIRGQADAIAAGVRGPWETFWGPGGWRGGSMMRKLGLSAGLSNGFETAGFTAMSLFAATLGTLALDAYAISHNMVSTVFMVGLGLAIATGVRVGTETGRDRPDEAAFAGWTGLVASVLVMGSFCLLIWVFRDSIVGVYTDDPDLQARTATLLAISALIFVPDAAQVVMGQAVRALGDAWIAIAAYFFAFFVLMIPLGWWLISEGGMDERGLALAIVISCGAATVLLSWRFRQLTLREAP